MTDELLEWLRIEYKRSNHNKYHRYFSEWVINLTLDQINGFNNQMVGQLTKSKIKN